MKKYIFYLIFFGLTPVIADAQSVAITFLEKHGKDDNIRVVSIGKKMLKKIEEQSLGSPELLEAIKGLDNMKIITSKDAGLSSEYYSSAYSILLKDKDFVEVYATESDGYRITVKKKGTKELVNELVILSDDSKEFNMIWLSGLINLEVLLQYSVQIGLPELKKFNDLDI
ncbi:MAG: DUF4252 domain-containing protein [Dysgonamonadaceae bacterium]|jgi:hypothetical protein|nr:DUF4252 domain-containing protein [Dysgonamonadaceae bacterium]